MPDVISKIPLGFNLDGYDFISKANTSPSSFGANGVDAAWAGGLKDDRWVADDSLKQVQFECTNFQSVPLAYINGEGKKEYVILSDGTGFKDKVGLTGGSAFGGSIFADCKLSNKRQLDAWGEQNKKFNGGSDDFSCGVAICPITLIHYLNNFYNLGLDESLGGKLCQTHAICVEVLYNTTASQGKAFRIKVVDSSGNKGYKGSGNGTGGWKYAYDVLDTMGALMLSSGFEDIVNFPNTEFGVINSDRIYFPWKSQKYDYKSGTIPGYSPSQLLSLGLEDSQQTVNLTRLAFKSHHQVNGHGLARGRFFADQENADKIKQVVPNIPDEFFQTNYTDGQVTAFGVDLSNYTSVSAMMKDVAAKIMGYAKYLKTQNSPMTYGACGLIQKAAQGEMIGEYYIPAWRSSNGLCNCDAFVNWVMLECGVTSNNNIQDLEAKNWTAEAVARSCSPGFTAIKVPDITQAEAGDILVYDYHNGHGHCAIFSSLSGASITGYGMGSKDKCSGSSSIPSGEPSTNSLKEIIRIVKA